MVKMMKLMDSLKALPIETTIKLICTSLLVANTFDVF